MSARVLALVATILPRRRSCERLLVELGHQSRQPDTVVLVLDGYGEEPPPTCLLPVVYERHQTTLGAGQRWLAIEKWAQPDDVVVCFDDDIMLLEAPNCIEALVNAVLSGGGAAAAMGRSGDGKRAPPGGYSRGDLVYGAGCGLAMRARHLVGLRAFAQAIVALGGPDALGPLGDDDALVSAFLWKSGTRILHAATGNIFPAPNTQDTSQTRAKLRRGQDPDAQKRAIKKVTGWPWPEVQSRL